MRQDPAFEAYFTKEIEPSLAAREGERRRAVAGLWRGLAIGGAIAAAAALVGVLTDRLPVGAFVGAVILLIAGGVSSAPLNRVRRAANAALLPKVAAYFGAQWRKEVPDPPHFSDFRRLDLAPSYDRAHFEDLLTGERDGAAYAIYEAHLEERRQTTDSKGRTQTTWVTVFYGQLCQIAYQKPFYGVTILTRDYGIFNSFAKPGKTLQRVGLSSSKFEKAFEAWSSDQVEARELLDPVTLERFLELERLYRGKGLRAAFADGAVWLSVRTGDQLKPGSIFRPLAARERVDPLVGQFQAICDLIDVAVKPLDHRTGGAFSVEDVR